jgi:hypothetical protein
MRFFPSLLGFGFPHDRVKQCYKSLSPSKHAQVCVRRLPWEVGEVRKEVKRQVLGFSGPPVGKSTLGKK